MKTVEMTEATVPLSEYARRVQYEAVVVTLRGSHPKFLEIMERSRITHREQGGISPDEMKRHFGLKPRAKGSKRRKRR